MTYTYAIYFSDELDGVGYNIGDANISKVVERLFDGLNVQSFTYIKDAKVLKVISELRLTQQMLNDRRKTAILKFKSGKIVSPYVMAELS